MKVHSFFLIIFSVCCINSCFAQDIDKTGNQFLIAYQSGDFDRMGTFYAENATFEDPTLSFFGMDSKTEGRDKITAFFKSNMGDAFTETQIKVNNHYVVGNHVIYQVDYKSKVKASQFGGPAGEHIEVNVPMTTILTFNASGKISDHKDYVDYGEYMKQVNSQLKKER